MKREKTLTPLAVALAIVLAACAGDDPTALWRVEKTTFLHQIRAEGMLRAASTQKLVVPREAGQSLRLAWLADDGQVVAAGDVIARFDRQTIDRQLLTGERDLKKAGLDAQRLDRRDHVDKGELETGETIAELDLEFSRNFQKKDEEVFSRRQIAESSIDQELAVKRLESATDAIGTQARLAKTEVGLVDIAKRKASLQIGNARKGLDALEVRAPYAGVFLRARLGRGEKIEPGGEMWPGSELGELPAAGGLQAEVYVLEADAGGLAQGQEAEVRVESQPDRAHRATISRIDAAARPRFRGSPVQYFGVSLTFEDAASVPGKLGQQISARLTVQRREDALVLPRQAIEQRDGKTLVQVRRGGGVEPVEIELGPASAGRVVVEKGLGEGDLVVLPRGRSGGGGQAAAPAAGPGRSGP